MLRAVKSKLKDSKVSKHASYNHVVAHDQFPFIELDFVPQNGKICPKEFHNNIIELMNIHLHKHPLIPEEGKGFSTKEEIYEKAVHENVHFLLTE